MFQFKWAVVTLLALGLVPTASLAAPTDPVVVIPVPDVLGIIFSPGIRLVADLEPPYIEEEYYVDGFATVYTYNDPPVREEIIPL
jgi:hypothetical protein